MALMGVTAMCLAGIGGGFLLWFYFFYLMYTVQLL